MEKWSVIPYFLTLGLARLLALADGILVTAARAETGTMFAQSDPLAR